MKKWWILWVLSIPIWLISYVYSIFITGKIAYLPQSECKPMFIFTPQDVQYCSDIYPVDVVLIALKTNPFTYIWLLSGLYVVGFIVYVILKKKEKGAEHIGNVDGTFQNSRESIE